MHKTLVVTMALAWSVLPAQQMHSSIPPAARVRFIVATPIVGGLATEYGYPAGTVVAVSHDTILLRSEPTTLNAVRAGDTIRVPLADILSGERYHGVAHHQMVGGVIGFAVSATYGFIFGDMAGTRKVCWRSYLNIQYCAFRHFPDTRFRNAAIDGGIGAAIGAALGYLARSERWDRITRRDFEVP
jgi:hypothetical protein